MSERTLKTLKVNASDAVTRLRSVSRRPAAIDVERTVEIADLPEAHASDVEQRRCDLLEFYTHYEDLVALLSDVSQYGPSPKLELDYQRLRGILNRGYSRIRRYVVAFLKYSSDDAQVGVGLWGRSADAFEALTAASSLQSFLKADNSHLASRILRTRDALNRYGEHLRRLCGQS